MPVEMLPTARRTILRVLSFLPGLALLCSPAAHTASEAPFGGKPWSLPGEVQAENFDTGGQNVSYYNPDGANLYGKYRPSTKISIENATDTDGGHDVGATRTGGWMNYTVAVATAGTYSISVRVASSGQGGFFHFKLDGADATARLLVPDTGGWQSWTTLSAPIALPAGKHILQLYLDQASAATASVGNFNWFSVAAPAADTARREVLRTLNGMSGHQTLVGQHNKVNDTPDSATQQITSITGKMPAYWSADFGFGKQVPYRQAMIDEATTQYETGALVGLMYHACPPTLDESCNWDQIGGSTPVHLNDRQWNELTTPGTALFNAWIGRLDMLATYFQQMKDAGQAVMFRPLHEMNQCVFWWACHSGANGSARLYQITHDYLAYTKGLDNIIWVWSVVDVSTLASDVGTYNPGASEYDIASLDVYNSDYPIANYRAMLGAAGSKPIAISESAILPTAEQLAAQPKWLYVSLWPDYIGQNASTLPALYWAPAVTTLDKMPGW